MTSTVLLLSTLFLLFAISLLLQTVFLRWGVKWASGSSVTLRKALVGSLLLGFANVLISVLTELYKARAPGQEILTDFAALLIQIVVSSTIIAIGFKLRFLRGFQAWLLTLIPSVALVAFLLLVFRPFVYEAYVVPTNSMAPAVLGNHVIAPCPRCGAPAYGSPPDPQYQRASDDLAMICSKELKTCQVPTFAEVGERDRILVSKLTVARRWDIIVFQFPSDPSVNFVKRLVGLPGETLQIRDGGVWINGKKLELPEELHGVEYLSSIGFGDMHEGAGASPVKLADDEYFVLGDFSAQASDSRFWDVGAPGHAPYAVPENHIIGVVTHIYWPINRWRAFR